MNQEAEKILRELGKKIDALLEKAKHTSGEVKEEILQKVEELKNHRDKFEDNMQDFRAKNEPKWQEAKVHLKAAAEELKNAFDKMFRKHPDEAEIVED